MADRAAARAAGTRVTTQLSSTLFRRRLPVLLQTEASECGLVCLAMVARYHGGHSDVRSLRATHGASVRGWSLQRLIAVSEATGLSARPLRVDLDELKHLACPAILHWDFDHFVVLKRIGARYATVHNPAVGERRYPLHEFSRHFTGVALELTPTPAFERSARAAGLSLMTFWRGIGARPIVQLLVLSTLIQLFALATPSYMQLVVDDVLVKQDVDVLAILALGFLMLALINVATKTRARLREPASGEPTELFDRRQTLLASDPPAARLLPAAPHRRHRVAVRLAEADSGVHRRRRRRSRHRRRHGGDDPGGAVRVLAAARRHRAGGIRRVRSAALTAISTAATAQPRRHRRRRAARFALSRNDSRAAGNQAIRQGSRARTGVAGSVRCDSQCGHARRAAEPRL